MISETERALETILDLGEQMLICGGEVNRVETTLQRLCAAYGAQTTDVLVITECIILTVRSPAWGSLTQTRRVRTQKYNLSRLSRLNQLSRQVCAEPVPPEEFRGRLAEICGENAGSLPLSLAVWALTAGAFCAFFGGNVRDMLCSAAIGAILRAVHSLLTEKISLNGYFSVIICSFLGGLLAGLPARCGLPVNAAVVSIGDIMLLVPGVALTNSLRDLFSGDTISGLLKFSESVILSLVIAGGFALSTTGSELPDTVAPAVWVIAAFFSAAGLGLWFRVDMRTVLPSSAVAAAAWGVVMAVQAAGCAEFWAYLAAAAFVGLMAEIFSRLFRTPATVFLVMGIIPMVPGGMLYRTMRCGIAGQWDDFLSVGVRTLMTALAISAGMFCVRAVFEAVTALKQKEKG